MGVRPARFFDVIAMVALLEEHYPQTRYAGLVEMDVDFARKVLAQFVQRHGGVHAGGTCCFVAERAGEIVGFLAGQLDRVYGVGTLLSAHDAYLVAAKDRHSVSLPLIRAYRDWAFSSPKIFEIYLTCSDVLPDGHRIEALYQKLGFKRSGAAWRVTASAQQELAA